MKSPTLALAIQLIERPSITPDDAGCQDLIAQRLIKKGFRIQALNFGEGEQAVRNLWATHGQGELGEPVFCLAGHTDVVPPGPLDAWDSPPFEARIHEGMLYGRGAADMKGSVAAMVLAAENFVEEYANHPGTLAILLTSDEEGPAIYGIQAVVAHFKATHQVITWAIVGEPSSTNRLGDTLKNGRRGSLGGELCIHGIQGHIAYPELAANPIALGIPPLHALIQTRWDPADSDSAFPPTQFQISNIQAGTGATNVIPGRLTLQFNLRFSPAITPDQIKQKIHEIIDQYQVNYTIAWTLSGLPFYSHPNLDLIKQSVDVIESIVGFKPQLSTAGGTSDARFIATLGAQVIEIGPVNATIHQVNECVNIADLDQLTHIYQAIIKKLLIGR